MPDAAEGAPPGFRALAIAAVLGGGLYGTGFWILHDDGPDAAAIVKASAALRAQYRPGDAIFLLPAYATRARESLGDLNPLAVKDPLAEPLEAHPRAWVLGLFDAGVELRDRMVQAGHVLESKRSPAPGITLDLYRTYGTRERAFVFRDHLKTARVFHEQDNQRTACDKWLERTGQGGRHGRWSCPRDQEWFYVAPEWHRMGEHLRLCLWAHPPHQGELVISFGNVPMTGHLAGRAGHTLNSSKHASALVRLSVEVADDPPQPFDFELQDHFRPFLVQTATTGTATVTFRVSSPNAGANHFCFDAEMQRERDLP